MMESAVSMPAPTQVSAGYDPRWNAPIAGIDNVDAAHLANVVTGSARDSGMFTQIASSLAEGAPIMAAGTKIAESAGAAFIPGASLISAGAGLVGAHGESNTAIQALIDDYALVIAAQLGIDPHMVGEAELRKAAELLPQQNKGITQELEAIDATAFKRPVTALAQTAVGIATAPTLAGSLAASFATGKACDLVLGERPITAYSKITELKQALAANPQSVNPLHVAKVYLAMDENLASEVEQHSGKKWHDLTDQELLDTLQMFNETFIKSCAYEAQEIQNGSLQPKALLYRLGVPTTQIGTREHEVTRMGGVLARNDNSISASQGAYTAAVMAERNAATAHEMGV